MIETWNHVSHQIIIGVFSRSFSFQTIQWLLHALSDTDTCMSAMVKTGIVTTNIGGWQWE